MCLTKTLPGTLRHNTRWLLGLAGLAIVTLSLGTDIDAAGTRHAITSSPDSGGAAQVAIVVRARRPEDLEHLAAHAERLGFTVTSREDLLPALRLAPPAGVSLADAVTAFRSQPGVLYAEPLYRTLHIADVPAAPLYRQEAPYLSVEHAPAAWDIERGQPRVIVAVLDTGVDLSHPDLQGRIWINPREIPNNGADDGANGCVDDVHGCAFVNEPSLGCASARNGDVHDDNGHGTFVAGVIAANGQGMVGVARGVTILPVKVLDCKGVGDSLDFAEGIIYAARAGAQILNVSLDGPTDSAIMREAVRIAHDEFGALVVAAAGNTGTNDIAFPAAYPGVLAVGAASGPDPTKRASFSSYGANVSVAAIGEGIVGTVPKASCVVFLPCIDGGPYAQGSGTSFSAPQVAGLAALMLSHRPALTADAIVSIIKETASPEPAGSTPGWAGAGLINMVSALTPKYGLGVPGVAKN